MTIRFINKVPAKDLRGKICLLRVDLNIEAGEEKTSYRMKAIIPTLAFLRRRGLKIVMVSHRGRPKGADPALSLRKFAPILSKEAGASVKFINHFRFGEIRKAVEAAQPGSFFLLENLRFLPGEEKNDRKLAKQLALVGDLFVNDAFAVSHRANASVAAITGFLPSYGGLLLEREIENLGGVMKNPRHPLAVIVGGAKVSDKLGVVKYFWRKGDAFMLGGGPANTFLKAEGMDIGDSIADKTVLPSIRPYVDSPKVHLPSDVKYDGTKILDIGPKTVREYASVIKKSKTVIWNGPMGLFEKKKFAAGTAGVWRAVLANRKAKIVVGGGETTSSLALLGKKRKVPKNVFLSTGGGAMLDFLSGEKLPGIEALKR